MESLQLSMRWRRALVKFQYRPTATRAPERTCLLHSTSKSQREAIRDQILPSLDQYRSKSKALALEENQTPSISSKGSSPLKVFETAFHLKSFTTRWALACTRQSTSAWRALNARSPPSLSSRSRTGSRTCRQILG